MSRLWKIVLLVVAVLVVVFIGLRMAGGGKEKSSGDAAASAERGGPQADAGPVPVTVVEAQRQDVPVYASALGTVSAMNTVTVSPQIGGQLMSLNFREGQEVKKGDVLAVIDPRSAQASYDEAAAAKRQNQAQRRQTHPGNRSRSRMLPGQTNTHETSFKMSAALIAHNPS